MVCVPTLDSKQPQHPGAACALCEDIFVVRILLPYTASFVLVY